MTAGIQIYRENGSLQFDASLMTYQLHSKGTVYSQSRVGGNTQPSTFLIPYPANYASNYFLATRPVGFTVAPGGTTTINGTATAIYQCSAGIGTAMEYYFFAKAAVFTPTSYGLELYNDAGSLTFSSNRELMTIAAVISSDTAMPAGPTYAVVQPGFAGHSFESEGVYRDGTPVVRDPTNPEGGGPSYQWSRDVDGKLIGLRMDGNSVLVRQVSYDDVRGQTNYGPEPDPARYFWDIPLQGAFVLNVSGF